MFSINKISPIPLKTIYPKKTIISSPDGIYLLKVNNKKQNKASNMFKVNNKDTRMTPLASFWGLYC